MKVFETGFEGLILIEPQQFEDNRGAFYESWRDMDYKKIGIEEKFLQDNVSVSKKNVLRGLHYRKNQGQLVTVTYGKIFDVVVDVNPESCTYKKYFSIELDAEKPKQLYMSPGFAHGFCVLSDLVIVNYKCTQYYKSDQESGIIWDDPGIGIEWPNKQFVISEKDLNFKQLEKIRT
ncbi:MAG: dTDP-4-dehydrorhamnose 3,5-epimerase [Gammaproteobacteria bacterium]